MLRLLVIFLSFSSDCALGDESDKSLSVDEYLDYASDEYEFDEKHSSEEDSEYDSRIVKGVPVEIEDYPYQCSFIGNNTYFCGCITISENYIITAGHCAPAAASDIILRVGSKYRAKGSIIPIKEVIVHNEYGNPAFDKDVAIFKTAEPIQFSDKVQPIPLADVNTTMVPDSMVTVSGWGRTRHGASTIPERLMAMNVTVVSPWMCNMSYFGTVTNNMFCAGSFWFGGKSACQGDSGGPVVQNGKAVGVVSFGRMCGQPLAPSVFAFIGSPAIRNFIFNVTGL